MLSATRIALDDARSRARDAGAVAQPAAGPRRAVLDRSAALDAMRSTVPRWRRHPSPPAGRDSRCAALRAAAASVEEAVDRRPGAADVGAEGAQRRGARRRAARTRGRSAAAPRGRADARRRRARRAARARALVEAASPSRSSKAAYTAAVDSFAAPAAGATSTTSSPAAARPARASCRRPCRAAGPSARKNGTSAPSSRGERVQRARRRAARASVAFARRSAVAASELPPPSPAATGMRFSMRARQRGSTPAAAASASSARRTSVSSREARRPRASAPARASMRSASVDPLERRHDLVLAVVAQRADDEREVDLRGGAARVSGARSASATNSGGVELLGAHVAGSRPIASSAVGRRARSATPASSSEFGERLAAVRERRLDDALHARESGGQAGAAERDERRLDVRPRPEHRRARPDGSRALRGELDEHRDGAVRLRRGLREEAVGDLALHHHAPGLDRAGSPSRLSTTSGVAMLYGRLATSFVGAGVERRRDRAASASPKRSSTFVAAAQPLAELRLERAVELDGVDAGDAVGEVARSGRRARARSRARRRRRASSASRPITPRMFSSTRKCWPSSFFGAHASWQPERRGRRSRRSALRARPAPRRAPRRARRACA